jgi:hypothetical protein
MVATAALLEFQTTELVRFSVTPEAVVPMTRNCPVCVGAATACVPGITVSKITSELPGPDELTPFTVTVLLAETTPVNPLTLAVIVVVPGPVAVTNPEELTLATEFEDDVQVAVVVMSSEVDG